MAKKSKELAQKGTFDLTNPTQNDIPTMIAAIDKKINSLKGGLPKETQTKVSFPPFGKVNDIKKASELIKLHSVVSAKENAYNSSKEELKELVSPITLPDCKLHGHSPKQWKEDIQSRLRVVAHENELNKLSKAKTTLESHLSEEMKLQKDLQAMAGLITENLD